jgi:hypothetical protein
MCCFLRYSASIVWIRSDTLEEIFANVFAIEKYALQLKWYWYKEERQETC